MLVNGEPSTLSTSDSIVLTLKTAHFDAVAGNGGSLNEWPIFLKHGAPAAALFHSSPEASKWYPVRERLMEHKEAHQLHCIYSELAQEQASTL